MEREREREYTTPPREERETRTAHIPQEAMATRVVQPSEVVAFRDRARWGAVWAGIITTLTTFMLLELLMYALGLLTIDFAFGGAQGGQAGQTSGPWVTAIVGIIAFFLGGWVAGATSAIRGTTVGLLNGFLVWGLATVLMFAFSAFGLGSIFGAIGQFLALGNINFTVPNVDPAQVAPMVRNAALWAFLSLLVAALASTIGGWVGTKSAPLGYPTSTEREAR
ncbi:MAG: hypothetical protein KatS3mg057_0654 [Herpetosiphonaceae bacterium]|nr:MAG: hypothetical protein KatS3mg057_0654 [Herpetosiphonaceae bacterium]